LRIHRFAYYIYKAAVFYPGFKNHIIDTSARDRHGIFDNCKPHLAFTSHEIESGESTSHRLGIGSTKFVCVLCRDDEYLEKFNPVMDWSYHDYRDVDIDTYIPALEILADRGYSVLRMGVHVKKALTSSHPRIIDYATNGVRTDFLDIYLSSKCYFFISNGTGLDSVAKIFHRPVLYTNYIPLAHAHGECSHDLIWPKKIWMRDEGRLMTIREILQSDVGLFLDGRQYDKHNLEIIDNTPEEIAAAVTEMDERLKGTWEDTENDGDLHRQFVALIKSKNLNPVFRSRISTEFLRRHRDLLQ